MDQLPRRISLVSETQAVVLHGLQTGRWKTTLPGERALSDQLGVSRWTLRLALVALAKGGQLQICQGLPCKITRQGQMRSVGPPRPLRIGLLLPRPLVQLRQYVSLWVDELRSILHNRDQALCIIDAGRVFSSSRPERQMQQLVDKQPCDAWILLLSSTAVQAWFQGQGLPAIIAGTPGENISLPSVDVDHRAAGVHIGHVLLRAGHRRIAYFIPRAPTGGVLTCEYGLRSALSQATGGPTELRLIPGDTRAEIRRSLAVCLNSAAAPTALVCAKASAALTVLSDLSHRELRVPRDLSVISVEAEPYFEHLVPAPTHYTRSAIGFAKKVARLIERRLEGSTPLVNFELELTYVPGETVGPCAK